MIQTSYEIEWQASERLHNLRKETQAYNELRMAKTFVHAQPVSPTIFKNFLSRLRRLLAENKRNSPVNTE